MEIFYTQKFLREYKKVSVAIKLKAEKREILFRQNPHTTLLKTHKLKGELSDFWSFSIDFNYRIIFEFQNEKSVVFHSIGNHDIYK